MATLDVAELKNVDNKTLRIVFGFIQQCQLLFDKNISYYNIPDLIAYICLSYYRNLYVFMNGINILTRDWKKYDEIEYDIDAQGKQPKGTHRYKGKILAIKDGAAGNKKIIIKCEHGGYEQFALIEIKLKLIDDGTPILTYKHAQMIHSASNNTAPINTPRHKRQIPRLERQGKARQTADTYKQQVKFGSASEDLSEVPAAKHVIIVELPPKQKRYKWILGENLLFTLWKMSPEMVYLNPLETTARKGKIVGLQADKFVIKQENGDFVTCALNQIRFKFEDDA